MSDKTMIRWNVIKARDEEMNRRIEAYMAEKRKAAVIDQYEENGVVIKRCQDDPNLSQ